MAHCEKHGDYIEQETVIAGFTFRSDCPICEKEAEEIENQEGVRLTQVKQMLG
jgi:Zn finger protein HypA/HybF involved in hydrogenase expression